MIAFLAACAAPWTLGSPSMDAPPPMAALPVPVVSQTHSVKVDHELEEAAAAFAGVVGTARVGLKGAAYSGQWALADAGVAVVDLTWTSTDPVALIIEGHQMSGGRVQARVIRPADGHVLAEEEALGASAALKLVLNVSAAQLSQ